MDTEIKTSIETDKLNAALVAVQRHGLVVIQSNENRQTRSKYAALSDIQTTIRPVLAEHGLAYVQAVGRIELIGQDSAQWMTTRIVHESGQWIEGSGAILVPFITSNQSGTRLSLAWASGSAISYARRYQLCAMLGILTGDDDDAEATARMHQREAVAAPSPQTKHIALPLEGPVADYTGGRWKEAPGPDNRLLGQYSFDELRNLVSGMIEEGTEIDAVKAILADSIAARLASLGEDLASALEARGWDDFLNPAEWSTKQWHLATLTLKKTPKPQI